MVVMPYSKREPPTPAQIKQQQDQQKRDGITSNAALRQKLARGKR
jgi:hypothetical protein